MVIGRHLPTEREPVPPLYRMRIFAKNETVAKSRSGTHNMYKEFRALSRAEAVEQMYQDMAARHRARFGSIHILKVAEIDNVADLRRPYVKQLTSKNLRFPLPHRRPHSKGIYAGKRPATFY